MRAPAEPTAAFDGPPGGWVVPDGAPLTVVTLRYDTAPTLELRRQLNTRIRKHARLLGDRKSASDHAGQDDLEKKIEEKKEEDHKEPAGMRVKQELPPTPVVKFEPDTRYECDLTDETPGVVVWREAPDPSKKRKRDDAEHIE